MNAVIKSFTQESSNFQIILLSLLGAALSIKLGFLESSIQFLIVSILIGFETGLFFIFRDLEGFNAYFAIFHIVSIMALTNPVQSSAVFLILTPIMIYRNIEELFAAAFLSHLLDALTTLRSIRSVSGESNPFMKILMRETGIFQALALSKTALVGMPLLLGYLKLRDDERILFAKLILILGLSLTARNILIFL